MPHDDLQMWVIVSFFPLPPCFSRVGRRRKPKDGGCCAAVMNDTRSDFDSAIPTQRNDSNLDNSQDGDERSQECK